MDAETCAERLPEQLERDRWRQQRQLPVGFQAAEHLPDVLGQVDEDERRELPDGLFGARLPQPATRKPRADGE